MTENIKKSTWRTDAGRFVRINITDLDDISAGFYATEYYTYTIPSGDDGTAAPELVLPANFKIIGIVCEDCDGIQAATAMQAQVAFDLNSALCDLYEQDDPSTLWSQGNLPATGTLAFVLTHTFGSRKIRLILTNPTTQEVVFKIYGFVGGS